MSQDDTPDEETEESETKSIETRHRRTGTFGAFALLVTLCTVLIVYVYRGTEPPLWISGAFFLAALAAVARTFRESALKAARESGPPEE